MAIAGWRSAECGKALPGTSGTSPNPWAGKGFGEVGRVIRLPWPNHAKLRSNELVAPDFVAGINSWGVFWDTNFNGVTSFPRPPYTGW